MKLRILKVAPKVFILQEFYYGYSSDGEWLGLEVRYNAFGLPFTGVFDMARWSMGSTQFKRCSHKSKESAMKTTKALKKHYKKDVKKALMYKAIEKGTGEVVHEEEI